MNEPTRPTPSLFEDHTGAEEGEGLLSFLKDNLEAIAVAVVMALVIKHFCVEAFKIPTSSMKPTLLGETDNARGEGDRILVDKFAYLLGDPQRWHVPVFRYPLNRARNFIKRIAGLPGETLRISKDGDLWVRRTDSPNGDRDLAIPQKPRAVREQFYRAVYPPPADYDAEAQGRVRAELDHFWRHEGGPAEAWRVASYGEFTYAGGRAATLRSVPSILEHTRPTSWASSSNAGELVRDVRFRLRLEIDEAPAEADGTPARFTLRWHPDDKFLAVLTLSGAADRGEALLRRGAATVARSPLDVHLEPGRAYDVEMEYVDGRLRAHVDGRELAVLADGRRFADTRTESGGQSFTLEAEGARLTVRDLRIDRDLRYENSWDANPGAERRGVDIPPDHYFMLGDNTSNSSDSRRWRMVTVHLRDGSVIRHDHNDSPEYLEAEGGGYTRKRVVDADGITREWSEDDQDPERGSATDPAPFVHRDLIVGRAFLVFWPCWPEFPGRLGFIH